MSAVPQARVMDDVDARRQWLQIRRQGIGSSDIATIIGANPFKSAYALYLEKTGEIEADDLSDIEYVQMGNLLEPVIASLYTARTGRPVIDHGRYAVRHHPDDPRFMATIDRDIIPVDAETELAGQVIASMAGRGPGILEAKTTGPWNADDWEGLGPLYYQVQLQWQLGVLGYDWGSLAALIGGQRFVWIDFDRNDETIALLQDEARAFLDRIERRDPPPVDGHAGTTRAIKKLHPADSGKTIDLPDRFAEMDALRAQLQDQIKADEQRLEALDNEIKARMCDATWARIPGGGRFQWKTVDYRASVRKAYTVRKFERLKR